MLALPRSYACLVHAVPPQSTILWYCQAGGTAWTRHEYDLGSASIRVPEGNAWCKRTVNRLASCQDRFYYPHSSTQCGVIGFSPAGLPELSTVPMKMVRPVSLRAA
jgi:hypothetical protein